MLTLAYNSHFYSIVPFFIISTELIQTSLDSSSAAPTPLLEVDSGNVTAQKQKVSSKAATPDKIQLNLREIKKKLEPDVWMINKEFLLTATNGKQVFKLTGCRLISCSGRSQDDGA